jgi:hypothetical protein
MSKDNFLINIAHNDSKSVKILVITKHELWIHIEIFQFLIIRQNYKQGNLYNKISFLSNAYCFWVYSFRYN